ncbi:MAG: PulJ/GspJ family protein [Phycisphaerales bacterium]
MNNRRGFTVIELALATLLGSLIVAVCLGVFGAIARGDERSQRRAQQVFELSRAHTTMQKAARLLVMDQPNILMQAMTGGAPAAPTGRPRIILERDAETGWQRLELVVAEPPILGSKAKAGDADPLAKYAAVRGAFELRPDDEKNPDSKSLYWVNYVPGRAEMKEVNSESLIATGLSRVNWRLAKTNAETKKLVRLEEAQIGAWNDLPAFVEVGVETIDGVKNEWMFEVCWSVAAKPKFGGIMDMLGGGESAPDETRTDDGATPGSGTDTANGSGSNNQNGTGPGGMSDLQFAQLMVGTLRNIRPTGANADLYRRMLRQYEAQLRDLNDGGAAGGGE